MVVKRRRLYRGNLHGLYTAYTTTTPYDFTLWDYQVTESEGHPWPSAKGRIANIGGPFYTIRKWIEDSSASVDAYTSGPGYARSYKGVQCIDGGTPSENSYKWPAVSRPSDFELGALGATLINRCIPTNPVSGLGAFLGELREGMPSAIAASLWRTRLRDYRQLGNEYLNVEFGWKPFASDLVKFYNTASKVETLLEQYQRDSGKLVRRRAAFPVEKTVEVEQVGTGGIPYPALPSPLYTSLPNGDPSIVLTTETETYFSGAFTYYADFGPRKYADMLRKVREMQYLTGVLPTPDVFWELAPWSWAIDWVTNFGDVFSNISRFLADGLVMPYAYVMQRKLAKRTITITKPVSYKGHGSVDGISRSYCVEQKIRIPATPFGFGLTIDAFSPRQWAILGALGIARGPRTL